MDDGILEGELEALKAPYKRKTVGSASMVATDYRFKLIPFSKVQLQTTASYLIRDIIPREGLIVVWGPPKCGKSFWALDAIMHVVRGLDYRGHHVKTGIVVYVACEGERGLSARIEAYRRYHEVKADLGFYLLTTRLDLVADRQQLIEDIRAQLGGIVPVAIVVDTLNRSIAGSESADEDMGNYVKAADAIRESFACAVIIIHHCGIDDKRPRGHTSLTGAADAQIAIRRDDSGLITATVEWLKDGAEGAQVQSRLAVVELDIDEDGEPITSCVIEPTEDGGPAAKPKKRKRPIAVDVLRALDFLRDAIADEGMLVNKPGMPKVRATTIELWRARLRQRGLYDGDDKDRQWFTRTKKTLIAERLITIDGDLVWAVPAA